MNNKSEEQSKIVEQINYTNVSVNAVPGSGKTTTCLHIANTYTDFNILLLVYNARLKLDTRSKISSLNLKNIESHSFHSFCKKYYDRKTINDKCLIKVIDNDVEPIEKFSYDLIIIDEAQDLNSDFYDLSKKIIKDNCIENRDVKLLIVGDINQAIYKFRKASCEYLLNPSKYYGGEWTELYLTTSFRITKEMADLVNNAVTPHIERKIRTVKSGSLPSYNMMGTKELASFVLNLLTIYNYDDIFILTPSTKTNSNSKYKPITGIDKMLVKNKIPVFIKTSDDDKVSDELMEGKVSILTLHQSKGLERKVVVLCGFDSSYYEYYGKDESREIPPNIFYVALTRAQEQLYVIHYNNRDYIPFVKKENIQDYCCVNGMLRKRLKKLKPTPAVSTTKTVTYLTSNLSQRVMNEMLKYIKVDRIKEPGVHIHLNQTYFNYKLNIREDVSALNGSAIPAYYELKKTGKITGLPKNIKERTSISHILKLINKREAKQKDIYSPKYQIKEFNWIKSDKLKECLDRMDENIQLVENPQFEKKVVKDNIEGRIDLLNGDEIWEFKCVSNLDDSYIIQLALYQYLSEINKGYLFNILSGELLKIEINKDIVEVLKLLDK